MNTKERIDELLDKRMEFTLNEMVTEDDHPSWGEVAEASAIAEAKWYETDEGKELKALLLEDEEQEFPVYYDAQGNEHQEF